MGDFAVGEIWCEEGLTEAEPAEGPEQGDGCLNERIAHADPLAAGAAAASQENPAEDGNVFPPCEDVFAVAAVGARRDDAFALGKAGEEDVEEAAEG